MPCYLFTWHAYGTWMPDRPQGYVKKRQGVLPPDPEQARRYRARQKEPTASFASTEQRLIIDESLIAAEKRRFRLHGVATEPTHLHLLLSWRDERTFELLRRGVRESISRRLNAHLRHRWLEQGGSRKQVREQSHFNYLMATYLPKHHGWKWREGLGFYQ
ncbi:hypothetical protein [Lacipirellula parvula]|uniref:Transposase IS200-like domain-containing protein n=1 Tax=Lacipirellula parvula TaxID=2650471 RepID=A0A5K7XNQ2_9BACT|nr:hypothetical protein [Lacipirellula parvula]BBO36513.1 hypothetical protein PLANPX_6125 [Lacipirellula parvula]